MNLNTKFKRIWIGVEAQILSNMVLSLCSSWYMTTIFDLISLNLQNHLCTEHVIDNPQVGSSLQSMFTADGGGLAPDMMSIHMEQMQLNRQLNKCPICLEGFVTRTALEKHLKTHDSSMFDRFVHDDVEVKNTFDQLLKACSRINTRMVRAPHIFQPRHPPIKMTKLW